LRQAVLRLPPRRGQRQAAQAGGQRLLVEDLLAAAVTGAEQGAGAGLDLGPAQLAVFVPVGGVADGPNQRYPGLASQRDEGKTQDRALLLAGQLGLDRGGAALGEAAQVG